VPIPDFGSSPHPACLIYLTFGSGVSSSSQFSSVLTQASWFRVWTWPRRLFSSVCPPHNGTIGLVLLKSAQRHSPVAWIRSLSSREPVWFQSALCWCPHVHLHICFSVHLYWLSVWIIAGTHPGSKDSRIRGLNYISAVIPERVQQVFDEMSERI
jgi:hypothetical protein